MERAAAENMTIFVNHSYDVPEDVVGSVDSAVIKRRDDDGEGNPNYDLDMSIVIDETNPRAVRAWESINNKVKLGLSIGAMIPKGGATYDEEKNAFIIHHVTLMETSIVSIPANPRSWVQNAVKALRTGREELDEVKTRPGIAMADVDDEKETSVEPEVVAEAPAPADETPSQEAPEADPETEAPSPEGEAEAELQNAVADLDTDDLDPAVLAAVAGFRTLLEGTVAQLSAKVEELGVEKQARVAAEAQRDDALRMTGEVLDQVKGIVEKIAETPLGRKTSFVEARQGLDHLNGIYSDRFLNLLSAAGETDDRRA